MCKILFTVFFAVILATTIRAIDEKSARESPCLNITNAIDPDATWFSSIQTWYYPLASRLDLYRSVHDLLKTDYKNIPEYSVYYDSCLEWGINSDGFTLNGYNGKSRFLRTTAVGPGTSDFKSDWSEGMVGRAYTTLTDNKTFAFTAACFADNQMSWNVFATTKTLDEATKQQIFEHAKSLGYNPEFFTEIRYDSCRSKLAHSIDSNTAPINSMLPQIPDVSSSENEVLPLVRNKTNDRGLGTDSLTCTKCKQLCPNSYDKSALLYKYYKKFKKYLEASH